MEIELSDVFQQLKSVSHLAVMVQDELGWNDYIRNYGARCARLEQLYLEIHDISGRFQTRFNKAHHLVLKVQTLCILKPTSNNFKPGVYTPTLLSNRSGLLTASFSSQKNDIKI